MSLFTEQKHRAYPPYQIPGKVFILGEYAALAGLPALLGTVEPCFEFSPDLPPHIKEKDSGISTFALGGSLGSCPQGSPLGRLMDWVMRWADSKDLSLPQMGFRFVDPYQGTGGFGASTAQFIAGYRMVSNWVRSDWVTSTLSAEGPEILTKSDWHSVWSLYRELTRKEPLPPSGADLVAQWEGGIVWFDREAQNCAHLEGVIDGSSFLVFSATYQTGRKVPTHEHLLELSRRGLFDSAGQLRSLECGRFQDLLSRAAQWVRNPQTEGLYELGRILNDWADLLSSLELEIPATREDRGFFSSLDGVIGVKGTGALQADAILVLLDPQVQDSEKRKIIRSAESRGLVLISDGIGCHPNKLANWKKTYV